jgi:hypothetical protein
MTNGSKAPSLIPMSQSGEVVQLSCCLHAVQNKYFKIGNRDIDRVKAEIFQLTLDT